MNPLMRSQNWILRQILIFPVRNALIVLALVALAGWGLVADGHALTDDWHYPAVVALALVNLGLALRKRGSGRRPGRRRGA